jgi:hypothetical protein
MPKIRWDRLPIAVKKHLLERLHDRSLTPADIMKLQSWIATAPDLPEGEWYKDFGSFKLAGEGEVPKTFLTKRQTAKGDEVD